MRPPICDVCNTEAPEYEWEAHGFVTRKFADYRDLPEGMAGHPDGLLWLCPDDDRTTSDLRHLESVAAIRVARNRREL